MQDFYFKFIDKQKGFTVHSLMSCSIYLVLSFLALFKSHSPLKSSIFMWTTNVQVTGINFIFCSWVTYQIVKEGWRWWSWRLHLQNKSLMATELSWHFPFTGCLQLRHNWSGSLQHKNLAVTIWYLIVLFDIQSPLTVFKKSRKSHSKYINLFSFLDVSTFDIEITCSDHTMNCDQTNPLKDHILSEHLAPCRQL